MTDENTQFYFDAIKHEIEQLAPNFYGNLEFKINYKDGNIVYINVIKQKSVHRIDRNR